MCYAQNMNDQERTKLKNQAEELFDSSVSSGLTEEILERYKPHVVKLSHYSNSPSNTYLKEPCARFKMTSDFLEVFIEFLKKDTYYTRKERLSCLRRLNKFFDTETIGT